MLYRKYRPKTFAEVEGQEHVVRTLQGALSSGRIGHAYLFSGPRGTGKTTIARLLAKSLNCTGRKKGEYEPCNACPSCIEIGEGRSLDLIEIDAASNRGIDEIRNIKESARVAASSGIHKVFLIDEVHMLTPPAFNALLKTLEEPSAHTIFILATTESHKVPETILSRVQHFDFKKLSEQDITQKLAKVAKSEKIKIDDETLRLLARSATGSLRDAESTLGKLIAYSGDTITLDEAAEILGIVPTKVHQKLLENLQQKNASGAIAEITKLHESGIDLEHFTKQFILHTRTSLVEQLEQGTSPQTFTPAFLVNVMNTFIRAKSELKSAPIPQLPLELAIMEITKQS